MEKPMAPNPTYTTGSRRPWTAIHNWTYWLDNPDLKQISSTNFELVVIDYSADGSAKRAFTAQQIAQLRSTSCQRRVVAYLSIGEAESYRGYWQSNWKQSSPAWLAGVDPGWQGNYWVRYWDPAWQQIIYRYLDAIIAAGFDGVYLDRVDAYQEDYAAGHEDDMVRFVANIAHYARSHSPLGNDFGIIVQNAEELAPHHPDYVQLVTGIAREEVYVRATNKPTSPSARATAEQYLDLFHQNSQGKLVLTVDYANKPDLVRIAYERARAKAYVPYVTTVDLDHLQVNRGYEPTCI
jgi:cysteinyl-tRNA synthetase